MMKRSLLSFSLTAIFLSLSSCGGGSEETKVSLGKQLFNDTSLSRDGTQACATCHDAEHAFIDTRLDKAATVGLSNGTDIAAVSVGQDDVELKGLFA